MKFSSPRMVSADHSLHGSASTPHSNLSTQITSKRVSLAAVAMALLRKLANKESRVANQPTPTDEVRGRTGLAADGAGVSSSRLFNKSAKSFLKLLPQRLDTSRVSDIATSLNLDKVPNAEEIIEVTNLPLNDLEASGDVENVDHHILLNEAGKIDKEDTNTPLTSPRGTRSIVETEILVVRDTKSVKDSTQFHFLEPGEFHAKNSSSKSTKLKNKSREKTVVKAKPTKKSAKLKNKVVEKKSKTSQKRKLLNKVPIL